MIRKWGITSILRGKIAHKWGILILVVAKISLEWGTNPRDTKDRTVTQRVSPCLLRGCFRVSALFWHIPIRTLAFWYYRGSRWVYFVGEDVALLPVSS